MRAIVEDFENVFVGDVVIEIVNLNRATYKEAEQLKQRLDKFINDRHKKIIVDIHNCEFIDSTFLGVLVLSLKAIAKIGGDIRLIKPNKVAKTFMEKSGTLNVFNLYDSLDEAIKSFRIIGDQNYYLAEGASILI